MATPNDLYAMEPESVTHDIGHLTGCRYNHVPEAVENEYLAWAAIVAERIEIRFLKDFCFDGRRVWQLATVWFDGLPVMVIQNAGREGDDHAERFITDVATFMKMCAHIKSLIPVEWNSLPAELDPREDVEGLTKFYGNELNGLFEHYGPLG